MFLYVLFSKYFKKHLLLNKNEVISFLKENTLDSIDFKLDDQCSILISPTKDKIIIHNHTEEYFQKYAFGKSLDGVKNEAQIYSLFKSESKNFNTSVLNSFFSNESYCQFRLTNNKLQTKNDDIIEVLVEFFKTETKEICFENFFNEKYKNVTEELKFYFNDLLVQSKNKNIKFGLVHKDFKPWNVDEKSGPLIYDFEEATLGLPLEDFLNYHIDPLVSSNNIEKIKFFLKSNLFRNKIEKYLNLLGIDLDLNFYIQYYLFERTYFWDKRSKLEISKKYLELLKGYNNEK